jgi:hydrogenase expression/formation protein HypD
MLSAGTLELSKKLIDKINKIADDIDHPISIMHVCGTHEYVIAKNGLRDLLPKNLTVMSGPGCPVCVCPSNDIDIAIELGKRKDTIITTFGDMIRVPASEMSLYEAKAKGMDIRIVYSPHDAVELALKEPEKEVIFFAIGFETTIPLIAFELVNNPPPNFSIICAHKVVPPALDLLLQSENLNIDGFLLPGHVCSIIGSDPFIPYAEKYQSPMVVGGFEVNDVLISLLLLLKQIKDKNPRVENSYVRIVKNEGNLQAQEYISKAFTACDSMWRGIGVIPNGGYKVSDAYKAFDAVQKFNVTVNTNYSMPAGCSCDQVLIGKIAPSECPLFGNGCDPQHPIGPCMVSHEGACKISFMFKKLH